MQIRHSSLPRCGWPPWRWVVPALLLLLSRPVTAQADVPFVRGDVDLDGELAIADAVRSLFHLLRGEPVACSDSVDVDDNGALEVTDPIFALTHLFLGGAPPRTPFPSCGVDPTDDTIECDRYEICSAADALPAFMTYGLGDLRSVQFTPDDRYLLVSNERGLVARLDVRSGVVHGAHAHHEGWVNSVAISPDSRLAASLGGDGTARLWHLDQDLRPGPVLEHDDRVTAAAFSADASELFVVGKGPRVTRWRTSDGEHLGVAPIDIRDDAELHAVHVTASPGVVYAQFWGTICRADFTSPDPPGSCLSVMRSSTVPPAGVWLPEAAEFRLVNNRRFGRYHEAEGRRETIMEHPEQLVHFPAISGDGEVAALYIDGTVRLQTFPKLVPGEFPGLFITVYEEIATLAGFDDLDLLDMALSEHGDLLATVGRQSLLQVTDVHREVSVWSRFDDPGRISAVALSPDETRVATGATSGEVRLWNAFNGALQRRLQAHGSRVTSLRFSSDGRRLVTAGDDGSVRLWDTIDGTPLRRWQGPPVAVTAMALSPDDTRIVAGTSAGQLVELEAGSLREIQRHEAAHGLGVGALAYSPDGEVIFSGGFDGRLRAWRPNGEANLVTVGEIDLTAGIASARTRHDGDDVLVLTATSFGSLHVSRFEEGLAEEWSVSTADRWLADAVFLDDGRRIATAGESATLRFFSLDSEEPLDTLPLQTDGVGALSLSPSLDHILYAGDDGTARLKRLP